MYEKQFVYVRLQITELLDDERCEAECEELPQDGEEGPASPDSSQHTETDSSVSARYGFLLFFTSFYFLFLE